MRRVATAALVLSVIAFASRAGAGATLNSDEILWVVHDSIANQISEDDLGRYLDQVEVLLQGSQDTNVDVATCTAFSTFPSGGPALITSGGTLDPGLVTIDSEAEFNELINWPGTTHDRVGFFVQSINWCDGPTNAIGCAPIGGTRFVVALDAVDSVRPMVIAHERGHNAGLEHRTDDNCALLHPNASASRGCLNQNEALSFYFLANVTTSSTCACINFDVFQFPNPWSLNPDGTVCDDEDVCTIGTTCSAGLCEGDPLDCDDEDACTADSCDSVMGCFNDPIGGCEPAPGIPALSPAARAILGILLCLGGVLAARRYLAEFE